MKLKRIIFSVLVITIFLVFITLLLNSRIFKPWKSFRGGVCDFGGCYTSETNQKYNYWLSKAVEEKEPSLCNNVEGLDGGDIGISSKDYAVYFCKAEYGGRIGDYAYCLKLDNSIKYGGTQTQQSVCIEEIKKNRSINN